MIQVSQADVVYVGPWVGEAEVLDEFLENRDPVFIRLATKLSMRLAPSVPSFTFTGNKSCFSLSSKHEHR